jgi:hypothetical protein
LGNLKRRARVKSDNLIIPIYLLLTYHNVIICLLILVISHFHIINMTVDFDMCFSGQQNDFGSTFFHRMLRLVKGIAKTNTCY